MNFLKIILSLILIVLFAGCNKQIPNNQKLISKNNPNITKKTKNLNFEENSFDYKLSKNEEEFLNILKTDKYASLCSSQDNYLRISKMKNSPKKSTLINELFYEYTKNLTNSCIDKLAFENRLKEEKYKKRNQFYEIYSKEIDKKSLLEQFASKEYEVENILLSYAPKHPDFFKLISKLDLNKLSIDEYNKLRLNIERLKLIKDYNKSNFVQLNIPSYNFTFYENGKVERKFGTIVGKKEKQTPVLSSKLSHFIINPTWNIPDSIAKKTIIPNALKDKNYLKNKNIVIRKNYNLDSKKYNFKDINWKKYLKKHVNYIPYKFIQLPSKTNGMGRVKFMFPNDYSVYMHDTIGAWRFKSDKEKIRFVSHGCVRLEHPISFLKHLTINYTPKRYKELRKSYLQNQMKTVDLTKKIPVHITYLTSYIKDNGELGFYKDVYEYDKIQKLNFSAKEEFITLVSVNNKSL